MRWPLIENIIEKIHIPPGYALREMRREDIPELVQSLCNWYPDIVVGSESCHLRPEFYETEVFFREEGCDKPVFGIVLCHNEAMVGFMSAQKNTEARTLIGRMGVVAQEHRSHGLAHLGPALEEALGRHIGAELVYYFATLKTPHQQASAEKAGYQLVGIVPAYDRDMVSSGCIKRVYEAIYAKVLIDSESILVPPISALTPNVKRLWDFLFKGA